MGPPGGPPFAAPREREVAKSREPRSGTERRAFSSFSVAELFSRAAKEPNCRPHRCRQRCTHFLEAHERSRRCCFGAKGSPTAATARKRRMTISGVGATAFPSFWLQTHSQRP